MLYRTEDLVQADTNSMLRTLEYDLWKQLETDRELAADSKTIRDVPCLKLVSLEIISGKHDYMLGSLTDGRVVSFVVRGTSLEDF
jgi:hypothetical protein